jgi:hypothetical protein
MLQNNRKIFNNGDRKKIQHVLIAKDEAEVTDETIKESLHRLVS